MKRVCVIGCGGAGKSTFAKKLSARTGLPVCHLDTLFYQPGWVEIDRPEFDHRLDEWLKRSQWIIDGNFQRTMARRLQTADTVFFLDFPTWRCLYGALKRLAQYYGRRRDDMAEGCHESFDWPFLKQIFSFRKKSRPDIVQILENNASHCDVIILQNDKDVKNWFIREYSKDGHDTG